MKAWWMVFAAGEHCRAAAMCGSPSTASSNPRSAGLRSEAANARRSSHMASGGRELWGRNAAASTAGSATRSTSVRWSCNRPW